jgi:amylosucrase
MTFAAESLLAQRAWPHETQALLDSLPTERADALQRRLAQTLPGLRQRLSELYGAQPGFTALLDRVVQQAVESAAERDDALWALDLAREQDPAWHQRGLTGYCAYTERFAGPLRQVIARIPYLQELGINYLHLLPFLKAGSVPNDGGFAVASFTEVEPSLGDLNDLRALCAALREAGISLCSDFVLNHVSHEHAWAEAARAGDPTFINYFHWLPDEPAVKARERSLSQVFPATAPGNFTWVPERNAWVWTTFYPYQWDLNYANPAVFADMAQAMLFLANQGIESFRLDSTGYLWKREGTNCQNQPEVHMIVQALRALCRIAAPAVLLKAEAIMPTAELPPYFGLGQVRGPECQLAYHSSLMAAAWVALSEQSPEVVAQVLQNTPALPGGCSWLTYVRCHDDIGWNVLRPELIAMGADPQKRLAQSSAFYAGDTPGSFAHGESFQASQPGQVHGSNGMTAALTGLTPGQDEGAALQRIELMYSLAFFCGGLPLIYMGDELGQGNTTEAERAKRLGSDGRELHRPNLDETALSLRHDESTLPGRVFKRLRNLSLLRRTRLTLDGPIALQVLPAAQHGLLALQRGEQLGLFNFGGESIRVSLQDLGAPALHNLMHLDQPKANDWDLPASCSLWLGPKLN